MLILIRTKSVYGVSQIYPANREAEIIAKIAGTRTLTARAVAAVLELGLQVAQVFGVGDGQVTGNITRVEDITPAA